MNTISKESLVQLITAQVLAKINQSGKEGIVATKTSCSPPKAVTVKGIITARKLDGLSAVAIAAGTIITPAAKDYIKDKKIQVQVALESEAVVNQANCNNYHFWSVCSGFASVGNNICDEFNIINIPKKHSPDEVEFVLKEIHSAIENNSTKGGIIVVDTSPMALFATRNFSALRPIVGNYLKTIEDGVSQIGANLLILEKQYLAKGAMQELAKFFITLKNSGSAKGKQVNLGAYS